MLPTFIMACYLAQAIPEGLLHEIQSTFTNGGLRIWRLIGVSGKQPRYCSASHRDQAKTTGWRVVNHGPHTDGRMPKVQDIMKHEYMTIVVVDRLTFQAVATIKSVRPTSYNTGFAARQLSQMSMSYMGILADTEDADNSEPADSTSLPATT